MSTWVVFGCGFIGQRLVRALARDGEPVLACGRRKDVLASLEAAGASTHWLEATASRAFPHALGGVRAPVVVYALPMQPGLPPGETVSHAAAAARKAGARRFIYLSSTAVYGEGGDGAAVDEESPTVFSDPDARPFVAAEVAVDDARAAGLATVVLRLSPVYGPGRGVRRRLIEGSYQLVDDGRHVFSRVHVDDLVGIIRAAADRAPAGAVYCVADAHPCPQGEHAAWLCERLGLPLPPSVPAIAPGQPRRRIRNRQVRSEKLARELGYAFLYPSYREGELAVEQELSGGKAGAAGAATDAGAEAAAASAAVAASPSDDAMLGGRLEIWRAGALAGPDGAYPGGMRAQISECAPGDAIEVEPRGRTLLYVVSGSIAVEVRGSDGVRPPIERMAAGDITAVPAAGLSLHGAGPDAARVLIVSA